MDGGNWRRITLGDGGSREKRTIQRRMSSWRMALMGRAMSRGREARRRPVVVLLLLARDMIGMRWMCRDPSETLRWRYGMRTAPGYPIK